MTSRSRQIDRNRMYLRRNPADYLRYRAIGWRRCPTAAKPRAVQSTDRFVPLFAPLARARTEAVAVAFLDSDGRVLGMRHCPSESFTTVEVPIRAIAADALAFEAHHVVMAHNHPSGDPEPSREDLAVTRRIAVALAALGIRLVDHLVLAGDAVTSLRGRGLL